MNTIDILNSDDIDFELKMANEYSQYLSNIEGKLRATYGDETLAPKLLQDSQHITEVLIEKLSNYDGRGWVHLDGKLAVQAKTVMRWKLRILEVNIETKKKKGATSDMLKPFMDFKTHIEGILQLPAVRNLTDEEPLDLKMFLTQEKDEEVKTSFRKVIKGNCFIVIPSDKAEESIHESRYKAIYQGVSDANYHPIRNVDGSHPNWFTEIVQNLQTCELAVVDLTDMRPNCIWELGILNAWEVPVILIQEKNKILPSDIFIHRISIFYEGQSDEELEKLRALIKQKIQTVMLNQDRGKFLPALQ